jgi:hypothetical protein
MSGEGELSVCWRIDKWYRRQWESAGGNLNTRRCKTANNSWRATANHDRRSPENADVRLSSDRKVSAELSELTIYSLNRIPGYLIGESFFLSKRAL